MKQELTNILDSPGVMEIIEGHHAIEEFNRFLEGQYTWAVSGVDWRSNNYIERINADYGYEKIFNDIISRYAEKFSRRISVFFSDARFDIILSGDRDIIIKNIGIIEEWDKYLITEFWVFDAMTGALIEAYHEGYVTFSAP